MAKPLRQIVEAKIKRKALSQRVNIKTKGDVTKEKSARMKLMRTAIRQAKETGEKPSIGIRGNQRSWKAARKSAVREEALNEMDPITAGLVVGGAAAASVAANWAGKKIGKAVAERWPYPDSPTKAIKRNLKKTFGTVGKNK